MKKTVAEMRKGLSEGAAKIDISKGIGASLSKQLSNFKDEYDKFSRLTSGNLLNLNDSKEALKSGEQMIKIFKEIQRVSGNFKGLTVFDAKKMFPQAFQNEVAELQKKLNGIRSTLANLEIKQFDLDQAKKDLSNLNTKVEGFKKELAEKTTLEASLKIKDEEAQKKLNETREALKAIRDELKSSFKIKVDAAEVEKNTATSKLNMETEKINKARVDRGFAQEDFSKDARGTILYKGKNLTQHKQSGATKEEKEAIQQIIALYSQEEKLLKDLRKEQERLEKSWKELNKEYGKFDSKTLNEIANDLNIATDLKDGISDTIQAEADAFKKANEAAKELQETQKEASTIKEKMQKASDAVQEQETKVKRLTVQYNDLKSKVDEADLTEAFKKLDIDFSPEMLKNKKSIEELQDELNELDESDLETLKKNLTEIGFSAKEAEDFIDQLRDGLNKVGGEAKELEQVNKEMDNLRQQVLDFFSLTNSIQIVKRAVSSAFTSVKELDAVMTEAAVVTDFSISDMWEKLPEYASNASKLGVATKDLYGATTLYYQQGLKNNEAMALGVETMKMARIAGMQASEATTAMTAALRGFNMELNETNAQRVNDVYSELAAITAADANQIATAMGKTASIAASANMEFETTAAFLAQIIETTQEAPETAGTALKTIIARFSEVKNLRNQGLTSGQDEEGEAIDVNKIQTALRQVGISMEGFFAGTEGLDSILTKLAEKWDDLDFETQRYIATMAAGSRQQSRFIAMMSDYGRTTELVSAANNSAGASQKQFNKTLESLDAKLAQLKNQWQQFTMNIMDNELIKWGVDALTNILTVVNKLISALPEATRGFASLAAIWGTMQVGKKAIGGVSDKLSGGLFGKIFGKGVKIDAKEAEQDLRQGGQAAEVSMKQGGNAAESSMIQGGQTAKAELTAGAKQAAQILVSAAKQSAATEQAEEIGDTVKNLGNKGKDTKKSSGSSSQLIVQPLVQSPVAQPSTKPSFYEKLGKGSAVKGKITAGMAAFGIMNMVSGVAGLVESYKKAKTLDDELEKVGSTLAEVRTLASEAASEMDTLADAKVNFKDMSKALDEMTKGTLEWKKQLVKVNNSVLELLEKYPQLAKYVERGESGELIINESGWAEAEEAALKKTQSMQQAQLGLMMQKNGLQQEDLFLSSLSSNDQKDIAKTKMINSEEGQKNTLKTFGGAGMAIGSLIGGGPLGGLIGGGIGLLAGGLVNLIGSSRSQEDAERDATGGLTQKEFSKLAATMVEEGIGTSGGLTKDELAGVYQSLGYDMSTLDSVYATILGMGAEFDKLANSSYSLSIAQEQYAHQLIDNAAAASSIVSGSEYGEAAKVVAKQNSDEIDAMINKVANKMMNDEKYVKGKDGEEEATEELISEYAKVSGYTTDEVRGLIKENRLSLETMTTAVATDKVTNKQVDDMEKTTMALERYAARQTDDQKKDLVFKTLTSDGRGLTKKQLEEGGIQSVLSSQNREEATLDWLRTQGVIGENDGVAELEKLGLSLDVFIENFEKAADSFASGTEKFEAIGLSEDSLGTLKDQESGIYNNIANKFYQAATGGMSAENQVEAMGKMSNFAAGLEDEQETKFYEILGEVDWSNASEVEGLSATLRELGIVTEDNQEDFETLEDSIKALGDAASKASMDELVKQLYSISDISEDIRSGKQSQTFSRERYEDIIKLNPDLEHQFTETKDGYVYRGNLNDLNKILDKQSTDELQDKVRDTEEKIATGIDLQEKIDGEETTIGSGTTIEEFFRAENYFQTDEEFQKILTEYVKTDLKDAEWLQSLLWQGESQAEAGFTIGQALAHGFINWERPAPGAKQGQQGENVFLTSEIINGEYDLDALAAEGLYYIIRDSYTNGNTAKLGNREARTLGDQTANFFEGVGSYFDPNTGTVRLATQWGNTGGIGGDTETITVEQLLNGLQSGIYTPNPVKGKQMISYDVLLGALKQIGTETQINEVIGLGDTEEGREKAAEHLMTQYAIITNIDTEKENLKNNKSAYTSLFTTTSSAQYGLSYSTFGDAEAITEAKQEGMTARVYQRSGQFLAEQFAEALGEEAPSILTLALTSDFMDNNQALKAMSESLQGLGNVLVESKRNTEEYATSLAHFGNVFGAYFGAEFSKGDFLLKYQKEIEDFIKDPKTGWAALQKIMLKTQGASNLFASKLTNLQTGDSKVFKADELGIGTNTSKNGYQYITAEQLELERQRGKIAGTTLEFNTTEKWLKDGQIYDKFIEGAEQVYVFNDTTEQIVATANDMDAFLTNLAESLKNWKNPFDKFQTNYDKLEATIRQREILERRYNKMLEQRNVTAEKLAKLRQQELDSLTAQRALHQGIATSKYGEIQNLMAQHPDLVKKYGITFDEKGGLLFDSQKFDEQGTKEEANTITALRELAVQFFEARAGEREAEDNYAEVKSRGKDEYLEFEERVKDALLENRQREIDKLNDINTSINEANAKLIQALQKSIAEYRQARDNQRAEDEIADKQMRLAFLQQDTSGANANEILALQKEIESAQENHIDTLIDQKISDLQQQNDEAAEQRERQIQILEAQKEQYENSGKVWKDVENLIDKGISDDGVVLDNSKLMELLKGEEFQKLSAMGQQNWLDDLGATVAQAIAYTMSGNNKITTRSAMLSGFLDKGDEIEFTYNGQEIRGTINENGFVESGGKIYKEVKQNEKGHWFSDEEGYWPSDEKWVAFEGTSFETLYNSEEEAKAAVENWYWRNTAPTRVQLQGEGNYSKSYLDHIIQNTQPELWRTYNSYKKNIRKYKTGGLADYTGPAWLDGTKTRPELVLNARDTQNFIQLKDILASLLNSQTPKASENSGAVNYDIDINVETINNETDLDMIANYIENKIVTSANYRNNTLAKRSR